MSENVKASMAAPVASADLPEDSPASGRVDELGAATVFALFMFFVLVAVLRNTAALTYPYLYAEDGFWTSQLMRDGLLKAALHGRPDFPVLGLTLLIDLSLTINRTFFQDLTTLPLVVACVSSLFLGAVAALPLLVFKSALSRPLRILLGFLTALAPIGADGSEVFNRILNLGFYMPVVATYALFSLLYLRLNLGARLGVLAVVLVLMLTFPVVVAQFLLFCAFYAVRFRTTKLIGPMLGFLGMLLVAVSAIHSRALIGAGGADFPFRPAGIIEFVGARSLLYPFIAAVYTHLNDALTLVLLALFLLAATSIVVIEWGSIKRLTDQRLFLVLNFGLFFAATVVLRRGFTSLYEHYQSSFPDRYFTGLHILLFAAILVWLSSSSSRLLHQLTVAAAVVLMTTWFIRTPLQARAGPTSESRIGDFTSIICDRAHGQGVSIPPKVRGFVTLPSYPIVPGEGWIVTIPKTDFDAAARAHCRP